jgi:hypothetical protein
MTSQQVEKFLAEGNIGNSLQISFKTRSPIVGLFIQTKDFDELKSKNLWRIVSQSKIEEYKKSKNSDLAKIFNGTEFTRLNNL